jgi:hypothetical protein
MIDKLISFFRSPQGIAFVLVLTAVLFNAITLFAEIGVSTYDPNDAVFHLTATQQSSTAIRHGFDPNDFWLPQLEDGFTVFYYYQHFPHVFLAELDQITSSFIPLPRLFDLSIYVLLCFIPVSLYLAMRRFEFSYLSAGISALLVSLIATNNLLGVEYSSYIWLGYGLFTQLWAVFFFPLALAEIYRTLKGDGSWFWSVLLFTIVLLSHLIYGYMLIISAILLIFITPQLPIIFARIKRSIVLFILTGMTTVFFFVPILLNMDFVNRSPFMDPKYYSSYGVTTILNWLVTGSLFDYNRLPVITALFFVSLVIIFRYRLWVAEKYRVLLTLTFFWLVIFFGPATFSNALYTLLPFSQNILYNRFLGGFQIGVIMLIGASLPTLFTSISDHMKPRSTKIPILIAIVFMLVLVPVYVERSQFYDYNTQWKTQTQHAFSDKSSELTDITSTLNRLPPGRVYAGTPFDFGNNPEYKIGFVPLYSLLPQLGFDVFSYSFTVFGLSSDTRMRFDNTRIEQYNLFNIRYVLLAKSWTPASYYTKLKSFDDYLLYEVPTTGYFDLVDSPAVFYGQKDEIYYANYQWLISTLPQQKINPINIISQTKPQTELPVYSFSQIQSAGIPPELIAKDQISAGIVFNESVAMNEYKTEFTATRNSYLMLKTSYHPGWSVTIDEQPVTTVMVSPGFVAAPITAGTHTADFVYRPPFYRTPLLALGGLTILLAFLIDQYKKYLERVIDIS